jgi:hypothetical protein
MLIPPPDLRRYGRTINKYAPLNLSHSPKKVAAPPQKLLSNRHSVSRGSIVAEMESLQVMAPAGDGFSATLFQP